MFTMSNGSPNVIAILLALFVIGVFWAAALRLFRISDDVKKIREAADRAFPAPAAPRPAARPHPPAAPRA